MIFGFVLKPGAKRCIKLILFWFYLKDETFCQRFPHVSFLKVKDEKSPFHSIHPSSCKWLSRISLTTPTLQHLCGLPSLLPWGFQFSIFFGIQSSDIPWICPFHINCFIVISLIMSCYNPNPCLLSSFASLSVLDCRAALLQKSISIAFSVLIAFRLGATP